MKASLFFGTKNKKAEGAILIDIGSGSVGGAAVVFAQDNKPKIFFETSEPFPVQSKMNNRRLLPSMKTSLTKVIETASKQWVSKLTDEAGRKVPIKRIICTFSSPWHVSTTKTLHFKFEKSFVISTSFINDVVSYESNNFTSKIIKENLNQSINQEQKSVIAEQETLQTFVNGYPVSYPIDMKANEFEIALFMSAFPDQLVNSVENICGKYFPGIHPDLNSGTGVYFHVLKELFPNEASFIIVHISGETTDISVIKKEVITETVSFPLGRNFIIRRLMHEAPGVTPGVAISMIKVNSEGISTTKLSEKLNKIVSEAEEDWIELFSNSIHDFSKDFFLPTKVFILAGDSSAKTFSNLITNKKLPVRGVNTPLIVSEDITSSLFTNSIEGLKDNSDLFIAAEIYYSSRKYFGGVSA